MGALRSTTSTSYRTPEQVSARRSLVLTVANGAVYVQLGHGIGGVQWDEESYRLPGVHTIPARADAVRVRSAVVHAGSSRDPWPTYAVDGY